MMTPRSPIMQPTRQLKVLLAALRHAVRSVQNANRDRLALSGAGLNPVKVGELGRQQGEGASSRPWPGIVQACGWCVFIVDSFTFIHADAAMGATLHPI